MKTYLVRGFTLVEMLVTIAIIGVLITISLPAISGVRESARQAQCNLRLAKIGQAVEDYVGANGALPAGTRDPAGPIHNVPNGLHQSWTGALLPYLDQPAAAAHLDSDVSVYDPKNAQVRHFALVDLTCPSAPPSSAAWPQSNYAGCHHDREAPIDADNNGLLFRNSAVAYEQITDGRGYTLLIGEKRSDASDLGWISGTRATLRNVGEALMTDADALAAAAAGPAAPRPDTYVGGFGSHHSGSVLFLLADGSTRTLSVDMDPQQLQLLANRADGQLIESP